MRRLAGGPGADAASLPRRNSASSRTHAAEAVVAQENAGGDTSRSLGAPAWPCVNGSRPRAGRMHRPVVPALQNRMVSAAHVSRPSTVLFTPSTNDRAPHAAPHANVLRMTCSERLVILP